MLAAQALTIDHTSHGRLDLSLGAAWFDKEHREHWASVPAAVGALRPARGRPGDRPRLFSGDVVSYEGKVVSLDGAQLRPAPVQQPRPPIWIGGGEAAPHAPAGGGTPTCGCVRHPNSLAGTSARLSELASEAGRDPASIVRAGSLSLDDLEKARKHIAKWQDAGYGYLVCGWPGAGRPRSSPSSAA